MAKLIIQPSRLELHLNDGIHVLENVVPLVHDVEHLLYEKDYSKAHEDELYEITNHPRTYPGTWMSWANEDNPGYDLEEWFTLFDVNTAVWKPQTAVLITLEGKRVRVHI